MMFRMFFSKFQSIFKYKTKIFTFLLDLFAETWMINAWSWEISYYLKLEIFCLSYSLQHIVWLKNCYYFYFFSRHPLTHLNNIFGLDIFFFLWPYCNLISDLAAENLLQKVRAVLKDILSCQGPHFFHSKFEITNLILGVFRLSRFSWWERKQFSYR